MRKREIALCDTDRRYVERFADAVGLLSRGRTKVHLLFSPEETEAFIQANGGADVFLIGEEMYRKLSESEETEALLLQRKQKIFILCEHPEDASESSSPKRRFKYRDIRTLTDFSEEVSSEPREERSVFQREDTYMIGFYSPVQRTGQSTYIREMIRQDEESPLLLINMESYAGIFDREAGTLADLLYYWRQQELSLRKILDKVAVLEDGFYRIYPIPVPGDLWEIQKEEWTRFFTELKAENIYKKIYIDLSAAGVQGVYEIMEICDEIITPVREDAMALQKIEQYERVLRMMGKHEILEKTRKISI